MSVSQIPSANMAYRIELSKAGYKMKIYIFYALCKLKYLSETNKN